MLDELIVAAVYQHPLVQVQYSNEKASLEDVEAAKLRRYPTLSMQSETSGSKPVSILSAEQVIWSAGRAQALVNSAQATSELQTAQVQETQYQVALRVIDSWQTLRQATARLQDLAVTQQKLDQYRALMQRRVAAEVSAQIEMELIAARLSQTQVDMQQARSAVATSKGKLDVLLGHTYPLEYLLGNVTLKEQVIQATVSIAQDSWPPISEAVDIHPTVRKARFQAKAAQHDLKAQQAAQWPQLYARVQKQLSNETSTGVKDLYFGIKYEPGAGFSSHAQTRSVEARSAGYEKAIAVAQRDLQDALQADTQELAAARSRAAALEQAVAATGLVQASYERQFIVGRRNWQEVMNAVRENNDVRLSLVDARSSIVGTAYRLRVLMSDLSWQKEPHQALTQ